MNPNFKVGETDLLRGSFAMPSSSRAATAQANEEIVFIDAGVPDIEALRAGLRRGTHAVMLDATRPALAQIADVLKHRQDVVAIHVVAHGEPGRIYFASGSLSLATVDSYRDDLATIGRALAHDGEMALWACEVAHGPCGARFLSAVADATGGRVRGSSGRVGAASLGGRWQLDAATGDPVLPPLTPQAIAEYRGVLAVPTLTITDPLIDSSEVTAVPFTVTNVLGGTAVFIDSSTGLTVQKPVNSSTTSYTVDLSGMSGNVVSSMAGISPGAPPVPFSVSGNSIIVATDPNLVLSVAEFNSIPLSQWQGNPAYTSVTVADDGATISALTNNQIMSLASAGVGALQATSGDLALTRLQYLSLGAMTLSAAGEVVLADIGAQIGALTVLQMAGLAATGFDRIDSSSALKLSVAQYQALGPVTLTDSDVVTLADINANFAGLDFGSLAGIDKIDATDNILTINLAQYGTLGAALSLTSNDVVTLAASGADLGGLSPAQIAALAGNGIDFIHSTDGGNALSLSVAQALALGTVKLTGTDTVTVADDGTVISALSGNQIMSLASKGVDVLHSTSGGMALTRSQYLNLGAMTLSAAGEVVLADTAAQIGALTVPQMTGLAAAGFDRIDASNALRLSVAQYQALGPVALTASDMVTLADINANFAGLNFGSLAGIDKIDAIDNALKISLAQYGALSAGLTLTSNDVVTLAAPAVDLEALLPADFAAMAGKGIDFIHSTDGTLTLDVAQALAAVKLTASDTVTIADDGAVISALTGSQIKALATKGVDVLATTSGDLAFTRSQYLGLGAMTLAAAGEVVLADTAGQLAALTVSQLAGLAAAGFDRIDASNALRLSVGQYQALGPVALTDSDVVTLADTHANLEVLDFGILAGIDKIDAIDNALTISLAQYGALGAGLTLTGNDLVTLAAPAADLEALLPADFAAMAGKGIDRIDAADDQLSLSVAQFQALDDVIVTPGDALTVTGGDGNDVVTFSRQTFTASDSFVGGAETDTLILDGDYSAGLAFGTSGLVDVEGLGLLAGHSYNLTTADANVGAGLVLTVDGGGLGAADSLVFNGSAETNGSFSVTGGAGDDMVTGGSGNDTIAGGEGDDLLIGGNGADVLSGGGGEDTFVYSAPSQSTSTTHDTVTDFNAGEDSFDFDRFVNEVQGFSGTVSSGSFDSDLSSIFGDRIHSQAAAVISVTGGDLAGHSLLVVTADTSYLAGSDYVVDITGFSGTLTTANFK